MKYSALTRQWFGCEQHIGELSPATAGTVVRGSAGAIKQGTWVQFDLRIEAGCIESARFRAFACPHTTAIAAWLAWQAPGLGLVAQLPQSAHALQQHFDVPAAKLGRILLVEDAWCTAIRQAITLSRAGMV